ncbi:MAG: hypothetical protein AB198_01090 [Parcubacteria bacterium C7867-003]|nr:MAG: hypothetical protein AB198_01090 [Parcubacteria bacterium C7867-003]
MRKICYIIGVIFVVLLSFWFFKPSGIDPVEETPTVATPDLTKLPQAYRSDLYKFGINLPQGFAIDENHKYESTPMKTFSGVRFNIPKSLHEGTNLSSDSYMSIEYAPGAINSCSAQIFLDSSELKGFADVNGHRYTVAYYLGAGAGNRYDETVFATPVDGGCIAVRYFIHYGVYENYPVGTIKKFDEEGLKSLFDSIRQSLVLN